MEVIRETIELPVKPHTMVWKNDELVCYENGEKYYPSYDTHPMWTEMPKGISYSFGGQFDRAVSSPDSRYTLLYTNLGTKGLLLKRPDKLIREVNRSYYCADVYEYQRYFTKQQVVPFSFIVH